MQLSLYQGSPSKEVVEARNRLIAKLDEAWNLALKRDRNPSAVQMLVMAANQAQIILSNPNANIEELNQATADLEKAIEKYKAAD